MLILIVRVRPPMLDRQMTISMLTVVVRPQLQTSTDRQSWAKDGGKLRPSEDVYDQGIVYGTDHAFQEWRC